MTGLGPDWRKSTLSHTNGCVEVAWCKASASGSYGCVEVAHGDGHIHVRDSKDPGGPVLTFTPHEWQCFLDGVRAGKLDLPAEAAAR